VEKSIQVRGEALLWHPSKAQTIEFLFCGLAQRRIKTNPAVPTKAALRDIGEALLRSNPKQ